MCSQEAAEIGLIGNQSSDVNADESRLQSTGRGKTEPCRRGADHARTRDLLFHHQSGTAAFPDKLCTFPQSNAWKKNNLPLQNSHGGNVTAMCYWLCRHFNTISAAKKRTKVGHLGLSNGAVEKNCRQGLNNPPQILCGG